MISTWYQVQYETTLRYWLPIAYPKGDEAEVRKVYNLMLEKERRMKHPDKLRLVRFTEEVLEKDE